MAYHVIADVKKLLNAQEIDQLADDDGDGTPDAGVFDAIIEEADDLMFSWIRPMYPSQSPDLVTTVPKALRHMAARLSAWLLRNRQDRQPIQEYERIERWAKEVANGDMPLDFPTEVLPRFTRKGVARVNSDKEFNRNFGYGEPPPGGGSDSNTAFTFTREPDQNI